MKRTDPIVPVFPQEDMTALHDARVQLRRLCAHATFHPGNDAPRIAAEIVALGHALAARFTRHTRFAKEATP